MRDLTMYFMCRFCPICITQSKADRPRPQDYPHTHPITDTQTNQIQNRHLPEACQRYPMLPKL